MNNIQDIINFRILDSRLSYVLCSGADRVYTYQDRGEWKVRLEKILHLSSGSGFPGWASPPDELGWRSASVYNLLPFFRRWIQKEGNSILFSQCCVCGDHDLGRSLALAKSPVSHGYCDVCMAQFVEELERENAAAVEHLPAKFHPKK